MLGTLSQFFLAVTLTAASACTDEVRCEPLHQQPGPSTDGDRAIEAGAQTRLLADLKAAGDAFADHGDPVRFDRECDAAFRRQGLDLEHLDPAAAGKQLRGGAAIGEIAARVDQWCRVRHTRLKAASGRQLVELARAVDPDASRDTLRDQIQRPADQALPALRKLAAESAAVEAQPAGSLMVLAKMLTEAGDQAGAVSVLSAAARRFPDEFAIWIELGNLHGAAGTKPDPAESVRCFTRAVALRPSSLAAHSGLGRCSPIRAGLMKRLSNS